MAHRDLRYACGAEGGRATRTPWWAVSPREHSRGGDDGPSQEDLTRGAAYNRSHPQQGVIGMSRWMQVVAVALASVVGLVPAFAQVTYAQAVQIPQGDELADDDLAAIEGEAAPVVVALAPKAAKWIVGALVAAEMAVHRGCNRAVEVALTLATSARNFTQSHPLATNLTLSGTVGGLRGGLDSKKETALGRLGDAVRGAGLALAVTLTGHVLTTRPSSPPPRLPLDENWVP